MFDPTSRVDCRLGAPMGRPDFGMLRGVKRVYLRRIRINGGGYDAGGAYWGIGAPLYVAFGVAGGGFACRYFRAGSRESAKTHRDKLLAASARDG